MKRSFMRSRNAAKLCLAAGLYLQRPLHTLPPDGDGSKPQIPFHFAKLCLFKRFAYNASPARSGAVLDDGSVAQLVRAHP